MSKFPKGSVIVRSYEKRKVIEELGDLRFVSITFGLDQTKAATISYCNNPFTIQQLKDDGWKVEGEKQRPEKNGKYWHVFVGESGVRVDNHYWVGDEIDKNLFESANVFPTQAEAQAKCDKINAILKGE